MLLGELGRRVHVPRVGGGVLADKTGGEVLPAHRARGLEAARVELGHGPRPGPHDPVPRTRVPSLAVHDHRPGEHEGPHTRLGHGREQHGRAQVVVRDVVRRVGDPVAEPDLRGLVAHGIHTCQGAAHRRGVPHVGRGILPYVEDDRLVPPLPQGGDHVGPDEPGTAGDQYAHTGTLGADGRRLTGTRPYVMTP